MPRLTIAPPYRHARKKHHRPEGWVGWAKNVWRIRDNPASELLAAQSNNRQGDNPVGPAVEVEMLHTLSGYFRHIEGNACSVTVVSAVMPDQRVSGVGYQVSMLARDIDTFLALEKIDERQQFVDILIHADVHENSTSLYGFVDYESLKTFRALLKIQGVGPAAATNVLSRMSPSDLAQCICNEDEDKLVGVKGIGPMTAKRMIIELRGGKIDALLPPEHRSSPYPKMRDLFDAPAP